MAPADFSYYPSSSLPSFVQIQIKSLEGALDSACHHAFYVVARLSGCPVELMTGWSVWGGRRIELNHFTWNQTLTFPIKYKDLPRDAAIGFTVWDADKPKQPKCIGGVTYKLFGKYNTFRKGKQRLELWKGMEADCSHANSTPAMNNHPLLHQHEKNSIFYKLMKKYERGDIPKLEWLDQQVFPEIEKLRQKCYDESDTLFLYIETAQLDLPIVFHETPSQSSAPAPQAGVIYDPEIQRENLVEAKHRRLVRSIRSGHSDREMKPNSNIRDEIRELLKSSPTYILSSEEKDLLWKFRFYLTRDKKGLTKFLKAVDWSDPIETEQAVTTLLPLWVDVDVDDMLELLGAQFQNREVRSFAVSKLEKADDEDLQLYLFQLVQALKFENVNTDDLECSPLLSFLVTRSLKNVIMGTYFYWYLVVESEEKEYSNLYGIILQHYLHRLEQLPTATKRKKQVFRQTELVKQLCAINENLRISKEGRPKKMEKLVQLLSEPKMIHFSQLSLPLAPEIQIIGNVPEKANVFKSSLAPLQISFLCKDKTEYRVIFKSGDDLRQDQLVIQLITLMDRLLRKENIDLKLTPYKVLATGTRNGLIEYVDAPPLAKILTDYRGNMQAYLRAFNPDPEATESYGIDATVMDAYVRSCAGYCVITYILGIGDRHLDNLLLSTDGKLCHIDFGFLLGRDPKPFPPPMKLCREMVDCMGGMSSIHFARFRSHCYIAFNTLRKSANLIINLFSLMVDAKSPIQDLKIEPEKVVSKIQEKFRLDLNEEDAIRFFENLINDSVSALFPAVMETIHKWAQYWRR